MPRIDKPWVLVMGGETVGRYRAEQLALEHGRTINRNALRSGGAKHVRDIELYELVPVAAPGFAEKILRHTERGVTD